MKDIVFSNKRIKDDDLFKINNEVNLSQLKIIGQIGYIFLLLEADKEILIVDQHAAHERIIFERLKVGQISDAATIKTLLIPIYIILDSIQMSLLYEFGKKINGLGFEIEPFAENCAILRSLPMCFIKHDPEQIIKDLLLELSNVTKVSMLDELQNKIFGKIACYSAIKAGQKLHRQEIISLLKQLEIINYKTHCPHGRNIIKVLSFKQIGYWFDRS